MKQAVIGILAHVLSEMSDDSVTGLLLSLSWLCEGGGVEELDSS